MHSSVELLHLCDYKCIPTQARTWTQSSNGLFVGEDINIRESAEQ